MIKNVRLKKCGFSRFIYKLNDLVDLKEIIALHSGFCCWIFKNWLARATEFYD